MKSRYSYFDILIRVLAWSVIVGGTYFLITDKGYPSTQYTEVQ